jgi:transcriptional regulator with XRE-family HTH domain
MSQGDVEKRTGLLRCYLSRCENGHTVPSIDTLEKWARALGVHLYQVFYDGEDAGKPLPVIVKGARAEAKQSPEARQMANLVGKMTPADRALILNMAGKLARRGEGRTS